MYFRKNVQYSVICHFYAPSYMLVSFYPSKDSIVTFPLPESLCGNKTTPDSILEKMRSFISCLVQLCHIQ